jgi:integrase
VIDSPRKSNVTQRKQEQLPVKHQTPFEQNIGPKTPSSTQPIDPDKPLPIREWQVRFERYLYSIGRKATRERYARALEKFLGKHPGKTFPHQFPRPVINDFVEKRLAEGASVATVRLELSAIRGLFQFAMDMKAADVLFNPAKNVKLKKSKGNQAANRADVNKLVSAFGKGSA